MNKLFFTFFLGLLLVGSVSAASWYVSKAATGTNQGTSWTNAWNELNQINWNIIQPGDIIYLDGGVVACDYPTYVTETSNTPKSITGGNCGMLYTTNLLIKKNGTANSPIHVQLSQENGRNGTVLMFGGRSTSLPYCGNTNYVYQTSEVRDRGINIDGYSHIVVDGIKWGGIKVYGHNGLGIRVIYYSWQEDITFRNIEVYDNGIARNSIVNSNTIWNPDGAGISVNGDNFMFDKMLIHDNGQDAFQTCYMGEFNNIKINNSWIFGQRSHPLIENDPWNYCTHVDGVQFCAASASHGLTVENSIFGPGHAQNFLLGEYVGPRNSTVHNFTIRNSLLIHHLANATSAAIGTKYLQGVNDLPNNYVIDRVTIFKDINTCLEQGQPEGNCKSANWWSMFIAGNGHKITNSMFQGGREIKVYGNPYVSNNYRWRVNDYGGIATSINPMFADENFTVVGPGFADFDFTITNPAIPQNVGSSIHRVRDLIGKDPQSGGTTFHPADLNSDSCVSLGEISSYVSLWLSGNGVTLTQVSDGVNEWLGGC
jgi:hypothetical protein